jgi:hypothetical protein
VGSIVEWNKHFSFTVLVSMEPHRILEKATSLYNCDLSLISCLDSFSSMRTSQTKVFSMMVVCLAIKLQNRLWWIRSEVEQRRTSWLDLQWSWWRILLQEGRKLLCRIIYSKPSLHNIRWHVFIYNMTDNVYCPLLLVTELEKKT